MARSADDRLTEKFMARLLGRPMAVAVPQHLIEAAADLAATDGMSLGDALRIVSGNTRLPYGTARPKIR